MRKPGFTATEFTKARQEIAAIHANLDTLPNIVGPTYGAAMCDRAAKAEKELFRLELGLRDRAYDGGVDLDPANAMPLQPPAQARNSLDGSFPIDTPVGKGRLWPPLSAKEHYALGIRLKDAKARTGRLIVKLGAAFPQSDPAQLIARAKGVERALSSLCNELDKRAHVDCPAYGDCPIDQDGIGPARSWYYGPAQSPTQLHGATSS